MVEKTTQKSKIDVQSSSSENLIINVSVPIAQINTTQRISLVLKN